MLFKRCQWSHLTRKHSLWVKRGHGEQPFCCERHELAYLVEILLAFSHLRSLKLLPCIPGGLPVLFLSPTLRFQEMKIGRGVGPSAKMPSDEKCVIDLTVLHLRSIKFVTNAGVIGGVVEALF